MGEQGFDTPAAPDDELSDMSEASGSTELCELLELIPSLLATEPGVGQCWAHGIDSKDESLSGSPLLAAMAALSSVVKISQLEAGDTW